MMGNQKSQVMSRSTNVNVPQRQCCICFDRSPTGLTCGNDHMICKSCVPPYIEATSEDAGKLKDHQYVISCPVPLCKSRPYSMLELLENGGSSEAVNTYVTRLVEACKQNQGGVVREPVAKPEVVPLLQDALNLKCSNKHCRAVLDPTPDGCAAVRCANCATYVCFLCFTTCPNSTLCHKHVRECEYSPNPPDLFINQAQRQSAHKRVRVIQLRQILAGELLVQSGDRTQDLPHDCTGNKKSNEVGRQLGSIPEAQRYLEAILPHLKEVGISTLDVFDLNVLSEVTAGHQPLKQQQGPRTPPGVNRHIAHGQGPLLQPAIGRYVPWWEVCLIFVAAALFLITMVYLIFLLASVADLRKQNRLTEPFPSLPPARVANPATGAIWEVEIGVGADAKRSCMVEQLTEGVAVEDSAETETGDEQLARLLWAQLVDAAVILGTAGLYWAAVVASICLCVYRRW